MLQNPTSKLNHTKGSLLRIQSDPLHGPTHQNCLRNVLNLYLFKLMFVCLSVCPFVCPLCIPKGYNDVDDILWVCLSGSRDDLDL